VFANLGPIVADESMILYRSKLQMTSSPTRPADETKIAGRSNERKTALANCHLGKEKDEFVAVGVRGGSGRMLADLVKVKTEPGSDSSTLTGTPSNCNEMALHLRLVAPGIAQSKLIADHP
jgi:hypothetical protein